MLSHFATIDFDQLASTLAFPNERKHDRFYRETYPILLREIGKLNYDQSTKDYEATQVALVLVYSWMGRGILSNFDAMHSAYLAACPILLKVRAGAQLTLSDLDAIRRFTNGSVVAASKFLHFLAPTRFPIWDRRVASALGLKTYFQVIESPSRYLGYADWLGKQPISAASVEKITRFLGLSPDQGSLRAKEFLLFQKGVTASEVE